MLSVVARFAVLFIFVGCTGKTEVTVTNPTSPSGGIDYLKTTLTSPLAMAADGSSSMTVVVHLINNDNSAVVNFTPTYSVSPSTGVVSGACTSSDSNGDSSCVITSTTAEIKTFTLTNAKIGLTRSLNFILSQVTMDAASLPSTPILSRVISGTTWPLSGACDPAKGAVWIGGNGIGTALSNSPSASTPCNPDGTYSIVINKTCGAAPCFNGYSPELQVFQNGGLFFTTRLYWSAPTVVTTAAGLQAAVVNGSTVALGNDIDLSSIPNWTPVDVLASGARFYGDGHTLSNLTINAGAANDVGFFKAGFTSLYVDSVNFTNANVTSTGDNVGGLIGNANHSQVFKVSFSGNVSGGNVVGGLIGYQNNGRTAFLKDCTVAGSVTGSGYQVGGLIGWGYDIGGTRNFVSANVTGQGIVGGFIGQGDQQQGTTPIQDSAATGIITCSAASCTAGGFAGTIVGHAGVPSNFLNDYFSGSVIAPGTGVTNTFAGTLGANVNITSSYYLQGQTCQQCALGQGSALTATQMTHASSFVGWDFTTPIWVNATDGVTRPQPKR
jgi:hypothetical protein